MEATINHGTLCDEGAPLTLIRRAVYFARLLHSFHFAGCMTMCQVITHTAERRFNYVEARAGLYRTQLELDSDEALMQVSALAILCFDFADLVGQGNSLYDSINSLDNDWRNLVYTEVIPFAESFENRIKRLYEKWLDVSNRVIDLYAKIESEFVSRGFDTTPVHSLRKAVREVQGMLVHDSAFFCGAKLVELRDAAIDDVRNGTDLEFHTGTV